MEIICYSCGRGENPENSLLGIQHCISTDPSWRIEMDIQLTKDNHLVLFHDYETQRVTGVNRRIDELSLEELKKFNIGHHFQKDKHDIYKNIHLEIPTLESVFQQFPNTKLMLDVHTNNLKAVDHLIALVDQYKIEKDLIVVSHYDSVIKKFKEKRPDWRYGVPANEAKKMVYSSFFYLDDLFPIKSNILMLPMHAGKIKVLTKRVINHAKKRNKEIWAWMNEGKDVKNVNSIAEMDVMKNLGIDGIFTDYPSKLKSEMQ